MSDRRPFLLSEVERRQLLNEWAAPTAVSHGDIAVHQRFESHAEETPEAIALVFGEETLTLRVESQSDILAHRLIKLGVGPGFLIGIAVERWPTWMAAVLGTLKGDWRIPTPPAARPSHGTACGDAWRARSRPRSS